MEQRTERDLVYNLRQAMIKLADLKEQLDEATEAKNKAENALMEMLEANSAEATARYEGLGYFRQMKPRLYASVTKENEDVLLDYLKVIDRTDMIKTTVEPQTLSAFVKESIETGTKIPDFVSYYLKPRLRLFE